MTLTPNTWENTSLGLVARVRNGYAFKSAEFTQSGVPLVRQSNLSGETVDLSKCAYLPVGYLAEFRRFSLTKGDILIGMSGSVGKLCIFNQDIAALQNQRTGKIELISENECSERYVWHFLKTIEAQLIEKSKGVAVANVSAEDIQSVRFPLAPLAEQKRIADKLDTVLARVDAVNERLARVAPILKRFRQSVLAAATSGRLTEDWRNTHQLTDLRAVPLGEVIKVSSGDGLTAKEMNADGGIPVYGGNGVNGFHDKANVFEPTIVIGRVGFYCGSVYLTPSSAWITDNALRVRFDQVVLDRRFLYYALRGTDLRSNMSSTAQPVISGQKIYPIVINVPSVPEQSEIVRRVETLFALADRLEARLKAAQTAAERLTPALLAKAFRGELVPQDPNDEPASELLKRMAANTPPGTPQRGRPKVRTAE